MNMLWKGNPRDASVLAFIYYPSRLYHTGRNWRQCCMPLGLGWICFTPKWYILSKWQNNNSNMLATYNSKMTMESSILHQNEKVDHIKRDSFWTNFILFHGHILQINLYTICHFVYASITIYVSYVKCVSETCKCIWTSEKVLSDSQLKKNVSFIDLMEMPNTT
jgi:hypothetical protein